MKKYTFCLLLILFLCVPFARVSAGMENPSLPLESLIVSHPPKELTFLGAEALEGTALEAVSFSGKLKDIDAYAFANNNHLKIVHLPSSLRYIAQSAFIGNEKLVLSGQEGSYAHRWQGDHQHPFFPLTSPQAVFFGKDRRNVHSQKGAGTRWIGEMKTLYKGCRDFKKVSFSRRIERDRSEKPQLHALDLMFP